MKLIALFAVLSLSGCFAVVSDPCDEDLKTYCTAIEQDKKLTCLADQLAAGVSLTDGCLEKLYEMRLLK